MSWVLCMDYIFIFNHNIMFYDNVILYNFILDINKIAYTIDIIRYRILFVYNSKQKNLGGEIFSILIVDKTNIINN